MICEICKKEFTSLGGLHKHISSIHKLQQEDYYHSYFPRYDKYDNSLINYKSYEKYFQSDFNSRNSFAAWIKENIKSNEVKEYCLLKLKERLSEKGKLPSQVELKSLFLPTISGFDQIFGGIDKFLEFINTLGYKPKFDYTAVPIERNLGKCKIYQDTREQRPLLFQCDIEVMKLSVGDYTCAAPYYSDVYIERKSLNDLAGTLGKDNERFRKEIERANELGFYIVVVIEDLYSNTIEFTSRKNFGSRINGQHILHEIREITNKYDNIQFVFAGSRKKSTDLIEKIFKFGDAVKTVDLEYLKDIGKI